VKTIIEPGRRPRQEPGPAAGSAALRTDALTKRYGARAAVDGLSIEVPAGTVCGFVGPNGAGKTTTIRMLLGLARPSSGTAEVLGRPISDPAAYLARVGALIEAPAFYPTLSGRRNLAVLAELGGIDRRRVDAVLDQVDLGERAGELYRTYSLGMKQRLGLAAALLGQPELLILDEPTNGLDPPGIREVRQLLRRQADAGATVFVSSHLLDELQQVCDHLVVIDHGHLVFEGPVGELLAAGTAALVAAPESPADVEALVALCRRAGYTATAKDGEIRVSAPAGWAAELNRRAMAEGITLRALGAEHARLEDVFFTLTDRTAR
jgi:ABC-2 type transport system ATP-binding protein